MPDRAMQYPGTPTARYMWCTACQTISAALVPYSWITDEGVTMAPDHVVCEKCNLHLIDTDTPRAVVR